ncbi:unnamed protein product, partial [Hymenolepis diminuta]
MPRQSPTNQTRRKFLRLFRVPTASGADSSSQFVHSNTTDGALLSDGQQKQHHFCHGFLKTANSEGCGQESQLGKANPSPRIHLFNSANKPPKSGDYILRGAASSNKMGNVQQPYFYLILLVGSQLLYLCLRKWITSDPSADVVSLHLSGVLRNCSVLLSWSLFAFS